MPTRAPANKAKRTSSVSSPVSQHVFIENVRPSVDGGFYPAKGTAGRLCRVEADIFRDGHDRLRAHIQWKKSGQKSFVSAPLQPTFNDLWTGSFPLEVMGEYEFYVEAWTDGFGSWLADFRKRVQAGMNVQSEILEGLHRMETAADRGTPEQKTLLKKAASVLHKGDAGKGLDAVESTDVVETMAALEEKKDLARLGVPLKVWADAPKAEFSSWYEFFIRSTSPEKGKIGTFKDAEGRLDDIKRMGFDVIYLPPIHPIGVKGRKGKNNTLNAKAGDVGSPWAIGGAAGGHDAIDPALGDSESFKRFVKKAKDRGIDVALDFAIQCSPDHPWVKSHPEWFFHRPDGTIKYAENPPKKYEDIYPVNFDSDNRDGLYKALRDVLLHWIDHGVRIFRVDNPHTKPIRFWEWVIKEIHAQHPDIIFLAEAFTRPKVMRALAKVGFTQSYTYFTWRNQKWDLAEYLSELTQSEMRHYFRPNFFANTPDILHEYLQAGGRPAFLIRLILAGTLSSVYGIYSGFELIENEAVPGTEEYLNSEKYEIRQRNWSQPGNIKGQISLLNKIRKENPALQQFKNIQFLPSNNDQMIAFMKKDDAEKNIIIVVVNLDWKNEHYGSVYIPPDTLVSPPPYKVKDLLTGESFSWGADNYIKLNPSKDQVAHILRVEG